jgi:DNA-binding response OmpR family regulator
LVARVHALLRRRNVSQASRTNLSEAVFKIGTATINPKTLQVTRKGKSEPLTARELKLLQFFVSSPGEVMSREKLLTEVWGYNYYGTTRTLDQVIVQLRKKLGDTAGQPKWLVTVHGVGYKLSSAG